MQCSARIGDEDFFASMFFQERHQRSKAFVHVETFLVMNTEKVLRLRCRAFAMRRRDFLLRGRRVERIEQLEIAIDMMLSTIERIVFNGSARHGQRNGKELKLLFFFVRTRDMRKERISSSPERRKRCRQMPDKPSSLSLFLFKLIN